MQFVCIFRFYLFITLAILYCWAMCIESINQLRDIGIGLGDSTSSPNLINVYVYELIGYVYELIGFTVKQ